jgi:hypothetical protein
MNETLRLLFCLFFKLLKRLKYPWLYFKRGALNLGLGWGCAVDVVFVITDFEELLANLPVLALGHSATYSNGNAGV